MEEQEVTISLVDRKRKIEIAAGFNGSGTAFLHIIQLMGYRQRVAQELLSSNDEVNIVELEKLLEFLNNDIK